MSILDEPGALGTPQDKPEDRAIVVSADRVEAVINNMIVSTDGEGDNKVVSLPRARVNEMVADLLRTTELERVLRDELTRARALAGEDSMTHMPNHRALLAMLSREVARRRRFIAGPNFSVVMLDLDGFKSVNDTHGHLAGDAVLVEVAARINRRLRKDDFAARYGGDEFTVVGQESNGGSIVLADDIRELVSKAPVCWRGKELSVGASLGIVDFKPGTATDVDPVQLIGLADEALRVAKKSQDGKGQIYRYSKRMVEDEGGRRLVVAPQIVIPEEIRKERRKGMVAQAARAEESTRAER